MKWAKIIILLSSCITLRYLKVIRTLRNPISLKDAVTFVTLANHQRIMVISQINSTFFCIIPLDSVPLNT